MATEKEVAPTAPSPFLSAIVTSDMTSKKEVDTCETSLSGKHCSTPPKVLPLEGVGERGHRSFFRTLPSLVAAMDHECVEQNKRYRRPIHIYNHTIMCTFAVDFLLLIHFSLSLLHCQEETGG